MHPVLMQIRDMQFMSRQVACKTSNITELLAQKLHCMHFKSKMTSRRTGAVHGFEAELLLLDVDEEHVLLVVVCMPARLPQVKVVHVGRHHLLILVLPVQLPDVLRRSNSYLGTLHEPDGRLAHVMTTPSCNCPAKSACKQVCSK